MKIKQRKSIAEMRVIKPTPAPVSAPASPSSYALTPAERAQFDAVAAQIAALQQQARGMIQMLIGIHGLQGVWSYDETKGALVKIAQPIAPAPGPAPAPESAQPEPPTETINP